MDDPRLPSMRAADADRERVLEVVRQSHAEGRLTTPEFYERLDRVYEAKTYAELDEVVVDLPAELTPSAAVVPIPPQAVARAVPSGGMARMPRKLRAVWVTWATVVSINLVIWGIIALTALSPNVEVPYFWPIWVAGPWGVVLAGVTATWWLNRRDGGEPAPST